jgi:hypothetical protein
MVFSAFDWIFDIIIGRAALRQYSDVNNGGATQSGNFDSNIGSAECEACNAALNLSTNSAFVLGLRKTTENR